MILHLLVALLTGCGSEPPPPPAEPPPPEEKEVPNAMISNCEPKALQRRADNYGIQLTFAPCGINDIHTFTWAPAGMKVYFDLVDGAYLLDAGRHYIRHLDVPTPLTNGVWLSDDRVAFLLPPEEAHPTQRIAAFDFKKKLLIPVDTQVKEPRDLIRSDLLQSLFVTGLDEQGVRRPYRLDIQTGKVERALPWLLDPVDSLTYSVLSGWVGWGTGNVAHVARLDGTGRVDWEDASRATVHPDGQWVVLERPAPEGGLEGLDLVDLKSGRRHPMGRLQGRTFEWYAARSSFGSFVLTGIDGREFNRNVAIVDFSERFVQMENGVTDEDMEAPITTVSLPEATPAKAPAPQ